MKKFLILSLSGALCGFVNGFLGTGGGIIIVTVLGALVKQSDCEKKIFATANFVIMLLSLISIFTYFVKGRLTGEMFFNALPIYLLPALFGALFGALALEDISTGLLKKLFYIIICWSGIKMLF